MASAGEKLLERMRRTQFGWGEDDFYTLYKSFGFKERRKGKHTVYWHPDFPGREYIATVGRHKKLGPSYANTAIEILDKIKLLQLGRDKKETE